MWAHNHKDWIIKAALFAGWGGDERRSDIHDGKLVLRKGDWKIHLDNNEIMIEERQDSQREAVNKVFGMIKQIEINLDYPFIFRNIGPQRITFYLKDQDRGFVPFEKKGPSVTALIRARTILSNFQKSFQQDPSTTEFRKAIGFHMGISQKKAINLIHEGVGTYWEQYRYLPQRVRKWTPTNPKNGMCWRFTPLYQESDKELSE